jgi:hypothetical protein
VVRETLRVVLWIGIAAVIREPMAQCAIFRRA